MKIVLLPGLNGTTDLLSDFQPAFETCHEVVFIGYPTDLARYNELEDWIKDKLPKDDFVLVAESFSGPLAAMIGAWHLPNLKGIVFVATFVRKPRSAPAFLSHILELIPLTSPLMARLAQPVLMGAWSSVGFTQKFQTALAKTPQATLSKRLKEVLTTDVTAQLGAIDVPMLYLHATKDWLIPAKMSLDFASHGAEVLDIEGPHFLLQAQGNKSAEKIADFCRFIEASHQ